MSHQKKPSHKEIPTTQNSPRVLERPAEDTVSWHIRIIDKDGPWGWSCIDGCTIWDEVLVKLANFETMTWRELLGDHHHEIPKSHICTKALRRLQEINQDDIDQLVSIHLTGKKVIWGIRDRHILKVLWFDPEHTVCPSKKKHT